MRPWKRQDSHHRHILTTVAQSMYCDSGLRSKNQNHLKVNEHVWIDSHPIQVSVLLAIIFVVDPGKLKHWKGKGDEHEVLDVIVLILKE